MTITAETLKAALGERYDPAADYLVCGYNDLHAMQAKGYQQAGKVQDPGPGDSELLIFIRPAPLLPPPPPPPPPAPEPETAAPRKKSSRFGL